MKTTKSVNIKGIDLKNIKDYIQSGDIVFDGDLSDLSLIETMMDNTIKKLKPKNIKTNNDRYLYKLNLLNTFESYVEANVLPHLILIKSINKVRLNLAKDATNELQK